MKFNDICDAFAVFGIDRETIVSTINAAGDKERAAIVFDQLKERARARWCEMRAGDASPEAIAKARPVWESLKDIRLTNYTPPAAKTAATGAAAAKLAETMRKAMNDRVDQRMGLFMDAVFGKKP